jgi:hypothetical protein
MLDSKEANTMIFHLNKLYQRRIPSVRDIYDSLSQRFPNTFWFSGQRKQYELNQKFVSTNMTINEYINYFNVLLRIDKIFARERYGKYNKSNPNVIWYSGSRERYEIDSRFQPTDRKTTGPSVMMAIDNEDFIETVLKPDNIFNWSNDQIKVPPLVLPHSKGRVVPQFKVTHKVNMISLASDIVELKSILKTNDSLSVDLHIFGDRRYVGGGYFDITNPPKKRPPQEEQIFCRTDVSEPMFHHSKNMLADNQKDSGIIKRIQTAEFFDKKEGINPTRSHYNYEADMYDHYTGGGVVRANGINLIRGDDYKRYSVSEINSRSPFNCLFSVAPRYVSPNFGIQRGHQEDINNNMKSNLVQNYARMFTNVFKHDSDHKFDSKRVLLTSEIGMGVFLAGLTPNSKKQVIKEYLQEVLALVKKETNYDYVIFCAYDDNVYHTIKNEQNRSIQSSWEPQNTDTKRQAADFANFLNKIKILGEIQSQYSQYNPRIRGTGVPRNIRFLPESTALYVSDLSLDTFINRTQFTKSIEHLTPNQQKTIMSVYNMYNKQRGGSKKSDFYYNKYIKYKKKFLALKKRNEVRSKLTHKSCFSRGHL